VLVIDDAFQLSGEVRDRVQLVGLLDLEVGLVGLGSLARGVFAGTCDHRRVLVLRVGWVDDESACVAAFLHHFPLDVLPQVVEEQDAVALKLLFVDLLRLSVYLGLLSRPLLRVCN